MDLWRKRANFHSCWGYRVSCQVKVRGRWHLQMHKFILRFKMFAYCCTLPCDPTSGHLEFIVLLGVLNWKLVHSFFDCQFLWLLSLVQLIILNNMHMRINTWSLFLSFFSKHSHSLHKQAWQFVVATLNNYFFGLYFLRV